MHRTRYSRAWTAAVIAVGLSCVSAAAQIVTDGSVGSAQSLSGPAFSIGSALGTLSGNNLFHSFSTFNLATGESATFTGPSTLANIVARVTGGSSSSIDGTIATQTGGSTNLFLVNPAGVIFGPNASLNVEGSFHVSTADYLKFSDGAKFMSNLGNGSSFTTAAPAAFGFLTTNPAAVAITINGSSLGVGLGSALNIVGGNVQIAGGQLTAPGGTIAATAVASSGEIPLDPTTSQNTTVTTFGTASISGGSLLDATDYTASAPAGGSIYVRAGTLTVNDSEILASNYGSGPGGTIALTGEDQLTITNGSSVESSAFTDGDAASIQLTGGDITVNQDSEVVADVAGSGSGGDVTVSADSLTIVNGTIGSETKVSGNAGDITVDVTGALAITGDPGSDYRAGIVAKNKLGSTGNVGSIAINAGSITLGSRGEISSDTFGYGNGGNITVNAAGTFAITGGRISASSGFLVLGFSYPNPAFQGDAGRITLSADSITLADGNISSDTFGYGNGGDITVNAAGTLTITGGRISANTGTLSPSGVFPNDVPGGDAGRITVSADSITLAARGQIESSTSTGGNGGDIVVRATRALEIHGYAGIHADSLWEPEGDAGKITIDAGSVTIDGSGVVSTNTSGFGKGGGITIDVAGALTITGPSGIGAVTQWEGLIIGGDADQITISADSITLADGGTIGSGTYGSGNGGNIVIHTTQALEIHGDANALYPTGISADSNYGVFYATTGDAGSITIDAGSVKIDGTGQVSSNTVGSGQAGEITVSADSITLTDGGSIESATLGSGNGGNVSVHATGALEIHGNANAPNPTGISADSLPGASGDAGTITVDADSVTIDGTGAISGATFGSGKGGDVTVNVAGALVITGDPESLLFTGISAATASSPKGGRAGKVTINADSITLSDSGQIASSTFGSGDGGDVFVHATQGLEIHGNPDALGGTGIGADSVPGATGDAGTVTVDAGALVIDQTGQISSNTYGPGDGGDITVDVAGALAITGDSESEFDTGIAANSQTGATGDAGKIKITAGSVAIDATGTIKTNTYGSGKGGDVTLNVAGTLAITGELESGFLTGIAADSRQGATGDAGKVTVNAGRITIEDAAQISSNTFGSGKGGDVIVNADGALTITGDPEAQFFTGISAATEASGDAGHVGVKAGSITLADGGQIASSTSGSGDGGDIVVDATEALEIHGNVDALGATGIIADSLPHATGNAGRITVHADSVTLTDSGEIATNTSGPGVAGDILVKAQHVIVDSSTISSDSSGAGSSGSVTIDPTSILIKNGSEVSAKATGGGASGDVVLFADTITIDDSVVSTQSESGGGGNIKITASGLLYIVNGEVSATVFNGASDAGNVTIYADLLVLDQSVLSANAFEGTGGNLLVTTSGLIATHDSVLSASSERGVNGVVDVNALSSDVTSGLVELSGALVEDASRLACTSAPRGTESQFSTVIVHGRGDYDFDPDAPGSASVSSALASQDRAPSRTTDLGRNAILSGCDR